MKQKSYNRFTLSDIILGGQDGLVNVLGVILGVAAAGADKNVVIAGGLAATFAESISMAAVAYTSTLTDADYYKAKRQEEFKQIRKKPEEEKKEIKSIYKHKGIKGKDLDSLIASLTRYRRVWVDVMLSEEFGLKSVTTKQALHSALIVGFSAVVGSFVPLVPFFFFSINSAMILSFITSALALFAIGAYKARITVGKWYKSGMQIAAIGIAAAIVGYGIGLVF